MNSDDLNIEGFPEGEKKVELQVLGVSYSQLQSNAYAVILAEKNGPLRLPVVVGGIEAQAIAVKIEGITPPRPMTHDLIASLMHAYGIQLLEVFIYKFEDGIFSSEMIFLDRNGQEMRLDARTSDAIAVAMRTGAPLFTTAAILKETGFTMELPDDAEDQTDGEEEPSALEDSEEATKLRLTRLKEALADAIENEAYEEAARLTKEISDLESAQE